MLALVVLGFLFFSGQISAAYPETFALVYIFGFCVALVYWLKAENEWKHSEENPKNKNVTVVQQKVISRTNENKKSFSQTIGTVAAICTILTTIIIFLNMCSVQ